MGIAAERSLWSTRVARVVNRVKSTHPHATTHASKSTDAKTMTDLESLNLVIVLIFFLFYSIFFVYQSRASELEAKANTQKSLN